MIEQHNDKNDFTIDLNKYYFTTEGWRKKIFPKFENGDDFFKYNLLNN